MRDRDRDRFAILPQCHPDHYLKGFELVELIISQGAGIEKITEQMDKVYTDAMYAAQMKLSNDWIENIYYQINSHTLIARRFGWSVSKAGNWRYNSVARDFDDFQRFYCIYGGLTERDHPLELRDTLHISGYAGVMSHMKEILYSSTGKPIENDEVVINYEALFILNEMYSQKIYGDREFLQRDERKAVSAFKSINSKASRLLGYTQFNSVKLFMDLIAHWGDSWLACICFYVFVELDGEDFDPNKEPIMIERSIRPSNRES